MVRTDFGCGHLSGAFRPAFMAPAEWEFGSAKRQTWAKAAIDPGGEYALR
jgi:hypothetical protein